MTENEISSLTLAHYFRTPKPQDIFDDLTYWYVSIAHRYLAFAPESRGDILIRDLLLNLLPKFLRYPLPVIAQTAWRTEMDFGRIGIEVHLQSNPVLFLRLLAEML